MYSKYLTSVTGVVVFSLSTIPVSQAQNQEDYFERTESLSVTDREDPAYDPEPIPLGSFEIRPEAIFSGGLNSNVLANEINETDDTFVGFSPVVSIDSDWQRHAVGGEVVVDHREYSDLSDESRTNLKIKLRGRLDLGEKTALVVNFVGEDVTEDRSALSNLPNSIEPNEYTRVGGGLGFAHQAGRYLVQAKLSINSYDHDDSELAGDLFQDQDFRDRDEVSASARLAYAVNREVALYAQGTHTQADYNPITVFNAFNRDHSGSVLLVGSDFQFGDRVRGDIGVGYQYYTYDDASFEDISDIAFTGNVDVMLADRTTLSAFAARSVIDPGVALSNAAIETGASVRLEQGLTSKLSLSGEAGFTQYAFETIARDDDRMNLAVGANWKINPSIWLEGGYEILDQASDFQSFTDNRVLLKMRIFP